MATATTPLRSRDHVGNLAASLYDIQKDDFRGSMLPIRRLTRRDIEDQLNHDFTDADNWKLHHDQSIAACVPVETAANRNHRILRTYSIGPLFSQPQRPDSTHQHQQPPAPMLLPPPSLSALRSRDPLKLTPYLSQPLYGDEIYSAPPELFSITLDPDDYASKRRKIILHMETVRQKQDYVSGSTLARSSGTGNREQDTIDDSGAKTDAALLSQQQTATTTKSSLASTPIPQSTVSANSSGQTVTATTEDDDDDATTITATSSRSSVLSPPRPLLRPSYPTGWVPICPTDFQQTKCDELRRAAEQDTSEYKPLFLDTIGALNHPLVAMMDDYGVTEADKWGGSGKTQFLHDFITSLCELNKALKVAIITYDINNEGFLFDEIRSNLGLPCMRLGSVLDDNWEREYGTLLVTSLDAPDDFRQPTADVIIAFDIRIRPRHNVFQKIGKRNEEEGTPPIVWLVTVGSLEDRAAEYSLTDVAYADHWASNWWSIDPDYQKLLLAENTWLDQTEKDRMRSQVLTSVIHWVKSGFVGPYQFTESRCAPPRTPVTSAQVAVTVEQHEAPQRNVPTVVAAAPNNQNLQEQIRQIFQYSPLFMAREAHLSAQEDDDDESASFHSANEFICTESSNLNSRLADLKTEFNNQCQAIKIRIQKQYEAEMMALKQKYEQKALEEARNTQL